MKNINKWMRPTELISYPFESQIDFQFYQRLYRIVYSQLDEKLYVQQLEYNYKTVYENINNKFDNDLWKIAYESSKFYIDKDIIYSRLEFQLAEPINTQLNNNNI